MCASRHLHSIISVLGFLSFGCLDHWVSSIRYGNMILVVHEATSPCCRTKTHRLTYVCVCIHSGICIYTYKQAS